MAEKNALEKWVSEFNSLVENSVDPEREIMRQGLGFCDWRFSYGIVCRKPAVVYFLAIYPAFCLSPKFVCHYPKVSEMALDVLELTEFLQDPLPKERTANAKLKRVPELRDIVATVFAILRNKDAIELFQDQKDLMELGLKHYHLDNFYQDAIREFCKEYYDHKTFCGRPLNLTVLKKASTQNIK